MSKNYTKIKNFKIAFGKIAAFDSFHNLLVCETFFFKVEQSSFS